jgi:NAD-dependent SIR2 family protein deacetylase
VAATSETGTAGPAANVGRWFSTAGTPAAQPVGRTARSAWGPDPHDVFGRISSRRKIAAALEVLRGRRTAVLTGAGMSTDSGLPDYRGPDAVPRTPMTYQEFVGSDLSRRRYWARSTVGWTQFRSARPNAAHRDLAALADTFPITAVITQNVDGLHQDAGSDPVIDLHGRLDRVRCLHCGTLIGRDGLHARMLSMNPQVADHIEELATDAAQAPDGDAEVDRTEDFRYPPCAICGGMLKPDVVFFGENARPEPVREAFEAVDRAEALLVLGSSLTVRSGLRFVRQASADGKDVVIVGDGSTRGDDLATLRLHGMLDQILGEWVADA